MSYDWPDGGMSITDVEEALLVILSLCVTLLVLAATGPH